MIYQQCFTFKRIIQCNLLKFRFLRTTPAQWSILSRELVQISTHMNEDLYQTWQKSYSRHSWISNFKTNHCNITLIGSICTIYSVWMIRIDQNLLELFSSMIMIYNKKNQFIRVVMLKWAGRPLEPALESLWLHNINSKQTTSRKNREYTTVIEKHFLANKNANARTSHCMQKGGLGAG